MSSTTVVAVALALTTALLYAVSNVLKMLEAEQVPDEEAMKPRMIARLARRPRWLAGLGCDVAGYVTHAAALGVAAVVFVEPLLATDVLMSLVIFAAVLRRPVPGSAWVAAAVLSIGLAVFLYEVSPSGGNDVARAGAWAVTAGIVAVVVAVLVAIARGANGARRAALLGCAAGVLFGVSALLTKATVHYLGDGLGAVVSHFEPYALVVTAFGGLLVAQSALQTGALGAAISGIEALTVISGAVLGITLLDEHVQIDGAPQLVAVVIAIAAVLGALVRLAGAEQQVIAAADTTEPTAPRP